MGFLDSYLRLKDLAAESEARTDVKSQMASMQEKMNAANHQLAAMTQRQQSSNDPASQARRVDAIATVTSATPSSTQINGSQLVDLQLLVMLPAGVPAPVTVSELVSPLHLGRLQPGSRLAVDLDPLYPASVRVDWDRPAG